MDDLRIDVGDAIAARSVTYGDIDDGEAKYGSRKKKLKIAERIEVAKV